MIIIVFIELVLGIVAAVAVNRINGENGDLAYDITKSLMTDGYKAFYGIKNETTTAAANATRHVWNLAQMEGVSLPLRQALLLFLTMSTYLTLVCSASSPYGNHPKIASNSHFSFFTHEMKAASIKF